MEPLLSYVVESTKVPGEVVALTRYRGLQFFSLHLRQGESLPHVIGELNEKSGHEVLGPSRSLASRAQLSPEFAGVMGKFPDGIYSQVDHPWIHV